MRNRAHLADIFAPLTSRLIRLEPRLRAIAIYAIAVAILFPVSALLYGSVLLAGIWSVSISLLVLYIALRNGYLAETVMLQLPGSDVPRPERIRTNRGGIRFPQWEESAYIDRDEAEQEIAPDQRVIGFQRQEIAVAYPLSAMALREVANELVDDVPIAVTWSPVTYSPRVFITRGPRGEPFTLAPTPKSILNSPLLETENGTLYMQFTGEAIAGPDAGHRLELLPCVNTTWSAWANAWEETEALSMENTPAVDVFETYYASNRPGLYPQSARDDRLPDKDVVLGVFCDDGSARCYSAHELMQTPMLNHRIGDTPVLVMCERSSATYLAFDRRVQGEELTFKGATKNPYRPNRVVERGSRSEDEDDDDGGPNSPYQPWQIRDEQTDSIWHAISGVCVQGSMEGQRLQMLDARLAFWFAWSKIHPDVELVT